MSEIRDLQALATITQAKYDQQQQAYRRLQVEENRLRKEVARLDDMLLQTEITSPQIGEMRAIGADILWQGWVGRRKTELNLQLAQVLAIKEQQLRQVREAFGKWQILLKLLAEARASRAKRSGQSQLELAINAADPGVRLDQ